MPGGRVDISEYDDLLREWYVDEGLSVRETYDRLQEHLGPDGWTTHLAVKYRLQELGLKSTRGRFDELELALLAADPDDIADGTGNGNGGSG